MMPMVLVPADVDPWMGYRRYATYQLRDAVTIRHLRDVGFGVSSIAALLAARDSSAWVTALELQRETLVDESRAAQARLARIDQLLKQGEPSMSITIERRTIPAMTSVTLRDIIPTYSDEGLLWQRMMPEVARHGIIPIGPCGVIEHDAEYAEHDVDGEIFLSVAVDTSVSEPLTLQQLPARNCLVARVLGSYDQISQAHDMIAAQMAAGDLTPLCDGTLSSRAFSFYLTTPDEVATEELITEVCVPLSA